MTLPDRPNVRWGMHLQPDMLQALGALAVVSAETEELLHKIYWKYANLTEENGPIVTDKLNPKRLSEDIIKLVALDKSKTFIGADLKLLLDEFETLNTKRNHCLHWIWEAVAEDNLDASGKTLPYEIKRPIYRQSGIRSENFITKDIEEFCRDFSWLRKRLESHTFSLETLRAIRENTRSFGRIKNSDGSTLDLADLFYPAPWLDKLQ